MLRYALRRNAATLVRGNPVERKPDSTMLACCDLQLEEFAEAAQRLVRLIDGFFQQTVDALDAEGWNSSHAFALRAELVHAAERAEKAKRRSGTAIV
jgi:hypothetical protein